MTAVLDELEGLLREAGLHHLRAGTIEKWHVFEEHPDAFGGAVAGRVLCRMNQHFPHEAKARLIAAAVNALPALIAVARATGVVLDETSHDGKTCSGCSLCELRTAYAALRASTDGGGR